MQLRLEHLPADVFELDARMRAALAGRPHPPELRPLVVPRSSADVERPPEHLDPEERASLAAELEAHLAPLEPPVAVLDAVRLLRTPGACTVVGRVRPGLLGGPLANLWTGLHCASLARHLASRWGTPVVPLLYSDADASVGDRALWWLTGDLDLTRVALASLPSGDRPLGSIVLDEGVHRVSALHSALAQLAGPPRAARLEDWLPRSGESFARGSTRALSNALGPRGLVVIEPAWLRERLSRSLAPIAAAAERAFEGARPEHPFASRLGHHRRALRCERGSFRFADEPGSRNAVELAAELVQEPEVWSPGELVWPLAMACTLPVAAQVGRAAALEHRAVAAPLERTWDGHVPAFVPRAACSVVDAASRQALERLDTPLVAALRARGELVPTPEPPPTVLEELRAIAARTRDELGARRAGLAEQLDRGLAQQLRRTANEVQEQVEKLCARAQRLHDNRAGKARRHLRRIANALAPMGLPQEQVLSAAQVVVAHGTRWVEALADELEPFPTEHLAVHLEVGAR